MAQLRHQNVTPPLSGTAEHTLKLILKWRNEGHTASGPQQASTLWQQPQMGACLSNHEGRVFSLVSSIISILTKMKNTPFVRYERCHASQDCCLSLSSNMLVSVCVQQIWTPSFTPSVSTYGSWTTTSFLSSKTGGEAFLHCTGTWCNSAAVHNRQWISGETQHLR